MELRLPRRWPKPTCTLGELLIEGQYECVTLEDPIRADPDPSTPANEAKVPGETAIPAGRYRIILQKPHRAIWSPHPDGLLPHLVDVPGYLGIYIHAANTAKDVRGCIGVGRRTLWTRSRTGSTGENAIRESRAALEDLVTKLEAAPDPIWITIEDDPDPTGTNMASGGRRETSQPQRQ